MPKISCIMSVYNTEKYLEECIESILNQTFTDFEFIISDDGSTDKSKEIIQKYAKQDSHIIFLDNKKNRWTIVDNLNECLDISRWEFIAIMESDDVSVLNRFEKQIEYFKANPTIWLAGSWWLMMDQDGHPIRIWKTRETHKEIIDNVWFEVPFVTPWIMFRKSILWDTWWFSWGLAWDYIFYLDRVLNGIWVGNIIEPLIHRRTHTTNTSTKNLLKLITISLKIKKDKAKQMGIRWTLSQYVKIYYAHVWMLFYYYTTNLLRQAWVYQYLSNIWRKLFF